MAVLGEEGEVLQVASGFWAEQPGEGWRLPSLRWGHPLLCVSEALLFYHEGESALAFERGAGSEAPKATQPVGRVGTATQGLDLRQVSPLGGAQRGISADSL